MPATSVAARLPAPPVSAPASAQQPDPPSMGAGSGPLHWLNRKLRETGEHIVLATPEPLRERYYGVAHSFNHVFFPSRPAGPPLPHDAHAWTFTAVGDYGTGTNVEADVLANVRRAHGDLMLSLGDTVYWHGLEGEYRTNFDPARFMGRVTRDTRVMPALGNHDVSVSPAPYFARFPELRGAHYYSYDHGGVHFAALDSNQPIVPGSPEYRWLERDLHASHARWKVVYLHHPVFSSSGRSPFAERQYLAPLLSREGVDLILAGHEHDYERTLPLDGRGMTQVVVGGGSGVEYPFYYPQQAWSAYRDLDFGHLQVEVANDRLVGRYVNRAGAVRDTFVVRHRPAAPGAARLLYDGKTQRWHNTASLGAIVGAVAGVGLAAGATLLFKRARPAAGATRPALAFAAMSVVPAAALGWLVGATQASPRTQRPA